MHNGVWVNTETSQHPTLAEGEIHIWRIELDAAADAQAFDILSPDERARAERLKIPLVRARFVAGRTALRRLLGSYLGIMPQAVHIQYTPHGKPEIANADHGGLQFNLAHSDSLALLAVRRDHPIGIDLEKRRPITDSNAEYIARTAFTPAERDALAQLSSEDYLPAFFRCWTRKEAVMKAHGSGFRLAQSFTVTIDDTPKVIEADEAVGSLWMIFDLPIEPPFIAAIASTATIPTAAASFRLFNLV